MLNERRKKAPLDPMLPANDETEQNDRSSDIRAILRSPAPWSGGLSSEAGDERAAPGRRPFVIRSVPNARVALSGSLSVTQLTSLCSLIESNGKSALLRVITDLGPGQIWFRDGNIMDAEFDGETGEPALCRILRLQDARFEVLFMEVTRPRAIHVSLHAAAQRRSRTESGGWTQVMAAAEEAAATAVPLAPAVPRFDYVPPLPLVTASVEKCSRYSSHPGSVEVVRVPDSVRLTRGRERTARPAR